MDIIKILGYGITGFGFLLATMSYRLLKTEQSKSQPAEIMLKFISKYMSFSLILVFLGVVSIPVNHYFDEKVTNYYEFTKTLPDEVYAKTPEEIKSNIYKNIKDLNKLKNHNDELSRMLAEQKKNINGILATVNQSNMTLTETVNSTFEIIQSERLQNNDRVKQFFDSVSILEAGITESGNSINPNYMPKEKTTLNKHIQLVLSSIGVYEGNFDGDNVSTSKAIIEFKVKKGLRDTSYFDRQVLSYVVNTYLTSKTIPSSELVVSKTLTSK